MQRKIFGAIFTFGLLQNVYATNFGDKFIDYQKNLSHTSDDTGFIVKRRSELAAQRKALSDSIKGPISPEDYTYLKGTSAYLGSKADYAFDQMILGEGIKILLVEDSGSNDHQAVKGFLKEGSSADPIAGFAQKQDHGAAMAFYIHQVAPKATITLKHSDDVRETIFTDTSYRIINMSFGSEKSEGLKKTIDSYLNGTAGRFSSNYKLFIKSAGNEDQDLSSHSYYSNIDPWLDKIIFAGNLRLDFRVKASSGKPGSNPAIQDNFLWVVADNLLTASGPRGSDQLSPKTGTSGAAAILSGAAALIWSKYPELKGNEIREILLESADRDFIQTFDHGENGVRITDSVSGGAASTVEPRLTLKTDVYDKSVWGKGVLNIKNALIYARIRAALKLISGSDLSPANIRTKMLVELNTEKQTAARKIQMAWRSRSAAARAALEMNAAKDPLSLDYGLPARTFAEAEGRFSDRKVIPDPSAEDELRSRGLGTFTGSSSAVPRKRMINIDSSVPSASAGVAGGASSADGDQVIEVSDPLDFVLNGHKSIDSDELKEMLQEKGKYRDKLGDEIISNAFYQTKAVKKIWGQSDISDDDIVAELRQFNDFISRFYPSYQFDVLSFDMNYTGASQIIARWLSSAGVGGFAIGTGEGAGGAEHREEGGARPASSAAAVSDLSNLENVREAIRQTKLFDIVFQYDQLLVSSDITTYDEDYKATTDYSRVPPIKVDADALAELHDLKTRILRANPSFDIRESKSSFGFDHPDSFPRLARYFSEG